MQQSFAILETPDNSVYEMVTRSVTSVTIDAFITMIAFFGRTVSMRSMSMSAPTRFHQSIEGIVSIVQKMTADYREKQRSSPMIHFALLMRLSDLSGSPNIS